MDQRKEKAQEGLLGRVGDGDISCQKPGLGRQRESPGTRGELGAAEGFHGESRG